jgi:DNA-binding LytR/AlgR family response regulator
LNTKLRCLLLDDELPGLSYLKLLCEQIDGIEVVKAFSDPEIFLKEFPGLEYDLCILDIEMPGTTGIEIAKLIKDKPVIFTTAYKDYAADAFDLDAIDYVVKPIEPKRLQKAINRAFQRIISPNKPIKHLRINSEKGIALLDIDQLGYIRTSGIDSRDKTAFMLNGTSHLLKNISFKQLASLLPSESFCQVNKKEMISLSIVQYFSNDQITTNIYTYSEKPLILNLGESYRFSFNRKING